MEKETENKIIAEMDSLTSALEFLPILAVGLWVMRSIAAAVGVASVILVFALHLTTAATFVLCGAIVSLFGFVWGSTAIVSIYANMFERFGNLLMTLAKEL